MRALVCAWIMSALATALVAFDKTFSWQWWALTFWLGSFLPPLALLFLHWQKTLEPGSFASKLRQIDSFNLSTFVVLSLFAIPYFLYLESYPFLPIWDEVRDGGINTRQILDGTILNLFKYGRYNSHGLIIPTLMGPFYKFFGNSPLSYRVPAAVLSVLTGLAVFRLVARESGRNAALVAAAVTLSSVTHLHFGRTQVVPVLSGFFTALLLLYCTRLRSQKLQIFELGCLSLYCGFISGFHTSIRTVAIVTVFFLLCKTWQTVSLVQTPRLRTIRAACVDSAVVLMSFAAGFGPRILFSPPEIFFQARSFALSSAITKTVGTTYEVPTDSFLKFVTIFWRYLRSIGLYFGVPTTPFHLPEAVSIIPAFFGWFIVIGLLICVQNIRKNVFNQLLLYLFFALALSNSAITEYPLLDNRLQPLLIVGSVLCGFGVLACMNALLGMRENKPWIAKGAFVVILSYLGTCEASYFATSFSQRRYTNDSYLLGHLRIMLENEETSGGKVSIVASEASYKFLSPVHVTEFFHYFVPGLLIDLYQGQASPKDTFEIYETCDRPESLVRQVCPSAKPFVCPPLSTNLYLKVGCINGTHGLPAMVTGGPLVSAGPPKYIP